VMKASNSLCSINYILGLQKYLPSGNLVIQMFDLGWSHHGLYLERLQPQCPRREEKPNVSQENKPVIVS